MALLTSLYHTCPELRTVQRTMCAFMDLVRQHNGAVLDGWLCTTEQTQQPDLVGFVQGIRRDYAAVAAALEYEWSQGVVEGQVNRIKTVKRQLYGRASLPVLKQHLLLAAA